VRWGWGLTAAALKQLDRDNRNQGEEEDDDLVTVACR
jgi:hypothetical protein